MCGSMMKTFAVLLVLALATSAVVGDEAELIVAKTVLTRNPVTNQEMMVSVRIFNVGSGYVRVVWWPVCRGLVKFVDHRSCMDTDG